MSNENVHKLIEKTKDLKVSGLLEVFKCIIILPPCGNLCTPQDGSEKEHEGKNN